MENLVTNVMYIVPSSAVKIFSFYRGQVATKACLIGGMDNETADDGTIYMTIVTRFSAWALIGHEKVGLPVRA